MISLNPKTSEMNLFSHLLKCKAFFMKDWRQEDGEDFLTQAIHILEHPMAFQWSYNRQSGPK
jgi:hypothetical protein